MENNKHNELINLMDNTFMAEDNGVSESLAVTFLDECQSESACLDDIGYGLWREYTQHPDVVDHVLITLCGWSMRSLLKRAGIIDEDKDGALSLCEKYDDDGDDDEE